MRRYLLPVATSLASSATSITAHSDHGRRLDHDLLTIYYADLRRIARDVIRRGGQVTLQPTDLVHEAAVRLLEGSGVWIKNEVHLLALAGRVIRLTFIDEVRRRKAARRDVRLVTAWSDDLGTPESVEILRFDQLLDSLAEFDPEAARIVELRFYVGMSMKEIADAFDTSERTIHRRWVAARAWLLKELQPE